METTRRYQSRLVGAALGVLLALLIWPATGWMVRSQLALTAPVPAATAPWTTTGKGYLLRYHEMATQHPQDFQLQLADAVTAPALDTNFSPITRLERLRELAERFPDQPAIYATMLRFATLGPVKVDRDEKYWLTGDQKPMTKATPGVPTFNLPDQLAAYDRAAAEGERLDPTNAYFPFMRAAGLMASHRDAEALEALRRAAAKPNWADYCNVELESETKLHEAAFGASSSLVGTMRSAAILFPHLSQLRATSQVAIALAAQAEQAGHPDEGFAIRATVRECGSKIRVQSPSLIGNLVGIAITHTAMLRPGGAPPIRVPHSAIQDALSQERTQAYEAYMQRIGHPEQIAAMKAEAEAGAAARNLIREHASTHPPFDATLWHLAEAWGGETLLLISALWMLALGGGATLLSRQRWCRSGAALPIYARRGMTLSLFACPALAAAANAGGDSSIIFFPLAGLVFCLLLFLATMGLAPADRLRGVGVFGLGLGVITLGAAAFLWQVGHSIDPLVNILHATLSGEGSSYEVTFAVVMHVLATGIAAAVPVLTLLILSIISLVCRVPLTVGVVRGLRGCAVSIACVLVLVYAALIPLLIRQEGVMNEGLKHTVQHEGRYIAELAGKEWPGPTR